MELLLLFVLVLVALGTDLTRRRQRVVAWHRELDRAFGVDPGRDLPRHGRL